MSHLAVSVQLSVTCGSCDRPYYINRIADAAECPHCQNLTPLDWAREKEVARKANEPGRTLFAHLIALVAPETALPVPEGQFVSCRVRPVEWVSPVHREPFTLPDVKNAVERSKDLVLPVSQESLRARRFPKLIVGLPFVLNEAPEKRGSFPRSHVAGTTPHDLILILEELAWDPATTTGGEYHIEQLITQTRHFSPNVRRNIARYAGLPDTVTPSLIKDTNPFVRATLARHPLYRKQYRTLLFTSHEQALAGFEHYPIHSSENYSAAEIDAAIRQGDHAAITGICYHPHLTPEHHRAIVESPGFSEALVQRLDLAPAVLEAVVERHPATLAVLNHPACSPYVLRTLYRYQNLPPAYLQAVATHYTTPDDLHLSLVETFDPSIYRLLLQQDHLAPAVLKALYAQLKKHDAQSATLIELLTLLAGHPNLPGTLAAEIFAGFGKQEPRVRKALAGHPFLPAAVAQGLYKIATGPAAKDSDTAVAEALKNHPHVKPVAGTKSLTKNTDTAAAGGKSTRKLETNVGLLFLALFVFFIIVMFVLVFVWDTLSGVQ
jgi:hypothetical protein